MAPPYSYTESDQATVDAYESLEPDEQDPEYWSDETLTKLRTRVKAYYIAAQNSRCCYCNIQFLTTSHRHWDLEHVASRTRHPRFMFTPLNLAASCPDCNLHKGEKETLVNPKRKSYPSDSDSFRIIHPHFDNFGDHIFEVNLIYVGKTAKGKATIYMCDLLRFAQEYIDWKNSAADESFEHEVQTVMSEGRGAPAALAEIAKKLRRR